MFHEAILKRARSQPQRPALTFLGDDLEEVESLTYGQLGRRVEAVAAALKETTAPGSHAVLRFSPGLEFAVAFLACLEAGVVAVPVFPGSSPADARRLEAILAETGAELVLGDDDLPEAEPAEPGRASPGDAVFLQYTSGSTSDPRGVLVTHRNLVRNQEMIGAAFGTDEETVVVSWLPVYHDMGLIGTLLHPLYIGGRCVLLSPFSFLRKPVLWLRAIERYGGTTSGGPNFGYELCCGRIGDEELVGLDLGSWRVAFNGAEPIRAATLRRFAERFGPHGFREESFLPCYGLAEATLMVSAGGYDEVPRVGSYDLSGPRAVREEGSGRPALVSSGRPFVSRLAVVGPDGEELGEGEVGEIWIADEAVAAGYFGRPGASEETFGARLASGEGPFLRTGDLGFLEVGELFVTGREKDLLIVRGRNVYPQDVEDSAAASHPALRRGCGAAFGLEVEGEERLVVVHELVRGAEPEAEIVGAIRRAVAADHRLQAHTVLLVEPGSIPRTSSNKVRRRACRQLFLDGELPELLRDRREAGTAGPQAGELRAILAAALDLDPAALEDSAPIVSLGLDSMTAVTITHVLEERFGAVVDPTFLLDGSTVAELATVVAAAPGERPPAPLTDDALDGSHPASFGQEALWFFHRLSPRSPAYAIARAFEVRGDFDPDRFERAMRSVIRRHASLRTCLREGEPLEQVVADPSFDLVREDAAGWDEAELRERIAAEAARPFDLEGGPVCRGLMLSRSPQERIVVLVFHHVAADLWSLGLVLREIVAHYEAGEDGEPLPPAPSYGRFARAQRQTLEGEEGARLARYWERELTPLPPPLELPADKPRPRVRSFAGGEHAFALGPELSAELGEMARRGGHTLYTLLLGAYAVLLHRYSGSEDVAIGSPTSGRAEAGLARAVGYFVNPVVIRADLSGSPSFAAFLERLRPRVLGALAHQAYPFSLLVERLRPPRDPGRSPLFDAIFTMQQSSGELGDWLTAMALSQRQGSISLGESVWQPLPLRHSTSLVDVDLAIGKVGPGLEGVFRYSTELFEPETVAGMASVYRVLLEAVVEEPGRPVSELPLLGGEERAALLAELEAPAPAAEDRRLHELFEEAAARTPARAALEDDAGSVSFAELDDQAGRLATLVAELKGQR